MTTHLYFAAAFPEGHHEREGGSPTDRALAHLKSVLQKNRSSFPTLTGPTACRYGDVGSSISDALYRAADGQKAASPLQTAHIICIEGNDYREWIDWLRGMGQLSAKLVLAVSSHSGFTQLNALSRTLLQRNIKLIRLDSLVSDKGVLDALRYLTDTAS